LKIQDTFNRFASVRDVKRFMDKSGEGYKDYAFIQFYNARDAAFVIEKAKGEPIKLKGQPVFVSFRSQATGTAHQVLISIITPIE